MTTIVVGAIVFSFTFTLTQRPFLRDVIFYIIAVFGTFYAIWDERMYWWEGAGMTSSVAMVIIHMYLSCSICGHIYNICACCVSWTTGVSKISQKETWYRRYLQWV